MRSGPTQQDRELQSETIEEGTLWCVTHRFTKIQADRGLVARQVSRFPLLSIYPLVKQDSVTLVLSLPVVYIAEEESDSANPC